MTCSILCNLKWNWYNSVKVASVAVTLAWAGFNVWAEAFALDLGLTKAIAVMDSIGVSQTKILYSYSHLD